MTDIFKGRYWYLTQDDSQLLQLVLDVSDRSVNIRHRAVLVELGLALDRAAATAGQAGMVLKNGKSSGFVYGADIAEFEMLATHAEVLDLVEGAHLVMDKLSAFELPTACIIDGFALGGGLELALACDFLVAIEGPKTQLGLPEVSLGLLPGFGGTARSAARMGIDSALQFMLSGKPLSGEEALEAGLVDKLASDVATAEAAVCHWLATQKGIKPAQKTALRSADNTISDTIYQPLEASFQREHTPAPFAIYDHMMSAQSTGTQADFDQLKSTEKQLFATLMMSSASKGLRRYYHLQTKMKKAAKYQQKLSKMQVIGAGVMGRDIAFVGLLAGFDVGLMDVDEAVLNTAKDVISGLLQHRLKSEEKVAEALSRLSLSHQLRIADDVELVIEAASENPDVKRALFAEIEQQVSQDCLLATNTSSIPIEDIAICLSRPERLVGLHFFNPASVMKLIEVIQGAQTDLDILDRARQVAGQIGKWPVLCQSAPGFIVNRALLPYIYDAINDMLASDDPLARAATIDTALVRFGLKMGPLELADQIGLDVCLMAGKPLGIDEKVAAFLTIKIEAGELGRKTGQGIYAWQGKKAVRDDIKLTRSTAEQLASERLYVMLTACEAILSEKVAASADDIDAAMIFGTGFPAFRGGPLYWAATHTK